MTRMTDIVLDFHAHVLPGVDHGSDSVETSLYQLSEAKKCGVKHIFATSHFYPSRHSVDSFISLRNEAFSRLSEKLEEGHPKLHLGAEVLLCDGIDTMPGLSKLLIEGTSTLLLELPSADFSKSYGDIVYSLVRGGVDVVLAHAERYREEHIDFLVQNGARLQINASSLCGWFIPASIRRWMLDGHVVAVGSDIHMRDSKAYKHFRTAEKRIQRYISPILEYQKKQIE